MYTLQGFISIPQLYSTTPGGTAPIGQLSASGETFERVTTSYGNTDTYPDVELVAFQLTDPSNAPTALTSGMESLVLSMGQWLYNQFVAHNIPVQSLAAGLVTALNTQFPALLSCSIGQIIEGVSPTDLMPEYVQFQVADPSSSTHIFQCQLWFRNDSFVTQYQGGSMIIVPPISPISMFQNSTATVAAAILNVTPASIVAALRTAVGATPNTDTVQMTLNCCDPNNPSNSTPVTWYGVAWGAAMTDTDQFKAKIAAYIAANSSATNWNIIFPQLYAEFEFMIIPYWGFYASPGSVSTAAIWGSAIPAGAATTTVKNTIPAAYASAVSIDPYLAANLEVSASAYNGLQFGVVGNPNNTSSVYTFTNLWPDYADISPTAGADWDRISAPTQTFILKLLLALQTAATWQSTQAVPSGFTLNVFNSRHFLAFAHDGYTYNVLIQADYPA